MIDNRFRAVLPPMVDFLLRAFRKWKLTPNHITWCGFILAIVAAYLVFRGHFVFAILIWWLSRLLDACDGIYARKFGLCSKFGAYIDIQLDMAAYSLMVFAFYAQFPLFAWQWFLMIFCYVLCVTGALSLGAFALEQGDRDDSGRGLQLAAGLAEGGETGIMYTIFLLWPQWLSVTTWIWIFILTVTIVARFILAKRILRES